MGVSKSEVYREVQRGRKSQDAGGRT
jgi:hypothetical protein